MDAMELSIAAQASAIRLQEDIMKCPIEAAPDYLALVLLNLLGASEQDKKPEIRIALTKFAAHAAEILDDIEIMDAH